VLVALACCAMYCVGLTSHGLTNWQESQRALVVQEMHASGDWLVPTINNQPYLAKPPLFYWIQLGINGATSVVTPRAPGEFELRLATALGGILGVLATYVVARRLATDFARAPWSGLAGTIVGADRDTRRYARATGLLAAAMLATGILYTRSSRIGELDIWIVPFAVGAIGAIHAAWRTHALYRRTNFGAVALATVLGAGAALAKGPPAILPIAVAGYGSMVLWAALADRRMVVSASASRTATSEGDPRRSDRLAWFCGVAFAIVVATLAIIDIERMADSGVRVSPRIEGRVDEIVGVLALAGMGVFLGFVGGRLVDRGRVAACVRAFSRTHPLAVLGMPVLALWGWGRLVAERIGPENAAAWAEKEAEDNLQVLVAVSPIKNLEAASFGVALGSIACIAALVWIWRARPAMTRGMWVALAWVVLGFIGYSMLGKGIGRYLTPVWPGMAILGAMLVASLVVEGARVRLPGVGRVRGVVLIALAVCGLGIGQAWWYGAGRERAMSDRSPRAFMAELLDPARDAGLARDRIGSFEFWTAATSVYAATRVHPVGDIFIRDKTAGGGRFTLPMLVESARRDGPWTLLIRERQPNDPYWSQRPAIDRLREAGLRVTEVPLTSEWRIDGSARIPIRAVRVEAE
jgi:4-amino-4-deoxy-L-arabinose transferase-like glycosyltransferase